MNDHHVRQELSSTALSSTAEESASSQDNAPSLPPLQPPRHLKEEREKVVQDFVSFLGTQTVGGAQTTKKDNTKGGRNTKTFSIKNELLKFLLLDPDSPTGGALCAFPSLDLYSDDISSLPLPNVGASASKKSSFTPDPDGEAMPPPKNVQIPVMTASVFTQSSAKSMEDVATANADATNLEQAASRNLGLITTWTRSSVHMAPMAMLSSLASSFSALVDSRVRAWTLLLLRHSLSSGNEQSRSRLLTLLATSQSIDLQAIVTKFQALKMPTNADDPSLNENEVILPMIFEAVMDIATQGQQGGVKLRAPGIVSAKFCPNQTTIAHIKIQMDTNSLVSSMVEQARLVVFHAVAKATNGGSTNTTPNVNGNTTKNQGLKKSEPSLGTSFGSALNLSQSATTQKRTPRKSESPASTLKPSSSCLRLQSNQAPLSESNTQHPLDDDTSKIRKNRSVTWNAKIAEEKFTDGGWHEDKKRKVLSMVGLSNIGKSNLKSSKSFGKPDSSFFEHQRNATFAEFGHIHQNNALLTGNRLHLSKNSGLAPSMTNIQNSTFSANANATFDVSSTGEEHALRNKRNDKFSAASISLTNRLKPPSSLENNLNSTDQSPAQNTFSSFASSISSKGSLGRGSSDFSTGNRSAGGGLAQFAAARGFSSNGLGGLSEGRGNASFGNEPSRGPIGSLGRALGSNGNSLGNLAAAARGFCSNGFVSIAGQGRSNASFGKEPPKGGMRRSATELEGLLLASTRNRNL